MSADEDCVVRLKTQKKSLQMDLKLLNLNFLLYAYLDVLLFLVSLLTS